jgi:hypothetical protein
MKENEEKPKDEKEEKSKGEKKEKPKCSFCGRVDHDINNCHVFFAVISAGC